MRVADGEGLSERRGGRTPRRGGPGAPLFSGAPGSVAVSAAIDRRLGIRVSHPSGRGILDHARVIATASVRAPLRIALGGGDTDLASHYSEHGGFVVSAAIDRHVRIRVSPAPGSRYRLKHLEFEQTENPSLIRHPILRAAVARHGDGRPFTLVSEGDVAPSTGLGSSGAYTVCAVKAIERAGDRGPRAGRGGVHDRDRRRRAHGGQAGPVRGGLRRRERAELRPRRQRRGPPARAARANARGDPLVLRPRLLGAEPLASQILSHQVRRALAGDPDLTRNLLQTAGVARHTCRALEAGVLALLGELMNRSWALKRERLADVAMARVEELRAIAIGQGARGVMLMGAGGGGYLLAYAPERAPVLEALARVGARELSFGLDDEGCVGDWPRGGRRVGRRCIPVYISPGGCVQERHPAINP